MAVECAVLDSSGRLSSWIFSAAVQSRALKNECIEMVAQDRPCDNNSHVYPGIFHVGRM